MLGLMERISQSGGIFGGEMILQATPGIVLPLGETGSESCGVAATFPAQKATQEADLGP